MAGTDSNSPQPLPALQYIFLSAGAFVCAIGILLAYIIWAEDLIRSGISHDVFYVLLIPLGLSAAAFLFGAMRSFARIQGLEISKNLELGGPAAIFVLVVIAGFKIVPAAPDTFDFTVFVRGNNESLDRAIFNGDLKIDIEGTRSSSHIDKDGRAQFQKISAKYLAHTTRIVSDVNGFRLVAPDSVYSLSWKTVYVQLQPDRQDSLIYGRVFDYSGDPLTSIATVQVGQLKTKTDSFGRFRLEVPPNLRRETYFVVATMDGFQQYTDSVYTTGDSITIPMVR